MERAARSVHFFPLADKNAQREEPRRSMTALKHIQPVWSFSGRGGGGWKSRLGNGNNANGVVANVTREGWKRNGRNRVAVGEVGWTMTQGSSCLTTLGFGTESRWDSRRARRRGGDRKSHMLNLRYGRHGPKLSTVTTCLLLIEHIAGC